MRLTDIQTLYEYNYWAIGRILDTAEALTPEQLQQPLLTIGSLHGTLRHTLSAEWIWLERWQGRSPTRLLKDDDVPTLADLRARWREEEARMRAFIAGLTDADLEHDVHYRSTRGDAFAEPLGWLMAHVVNHGTQHRSEAAAMLTELGHSPGDLDLLMYLRQRPVSQDS